MIKSGPIFVRYFGPVLDGLRALGGSGRPVEVEGWIAKELELTEDEQTETLSSGTSRFKNQVHWARFYLAKENLIDSSKRGVWALTEKGRETHLDQDSAVKLFGVIHARLNTKTKKQAGSAKEGRDADPNEQTGDTAEESYREEMLEQLKALPAEGFERLCQRLLRESGFEEVAVTGRSGDGGIDGHGLLRINPFVTFTVNFQCKRHKDTVSPSVVRDFRGAMMGRADKGIVLTTGAFTAGAKQEATRDGATPIELVDGDALIDLFASLELGLKPITAYEIDQEFLDEFRNGASEGK